MRTVRAAQLVFARVEPACSRGGRAGYQTVYHSPSLKDDVVREIERHVRCFAYQGHPQDEQVCSLERLQFARLSDGRYLLARSVPAYHTEYIDKRSRPGSFIAHCLVISADQFLKAENNPFMIFDSNDRQVFVDDAESLHERFVEPSESDLQSEVSISVRPGKAGLGQAGPPDWPESELKKLLRLGTASRSIVQRKQSVLLYGDDYEEIANVLRVIFRFQRDKSTRLHCTFSTHVDGCQVAPGDYWALGAARRMGRNYLEVDVAGQKVVGVLDGRDSEDNSLFGRWFEFAIASRGMQEVYAQAYTIERLCEAFEDGRPLPDRAALSSETCLEFYDLFRGEVDRHLVERLSDSTSARIGRSLGPFVQQCLEPLELVTFAAGGISNARMAECAAHWLLASCRQRRPRLRKTDWAALRALAQQAEHWPLLHWSAVLDDQSWFRQSHQRQRDAALANMDEPAFHEALRMLGTIAPQEFVCARHLDTLLTESAGFGFSGRQMIDLLKVVLRLPSRLPDLSMFCDYLNDLSPREADRIFSQIKKRKELEDSRFCRKLLDRMDDQDPPSALQRWFGFQWLHGRS